MSLGATSGRIDEPGTSPAPAVLDPYSRKVPPPSYTNMPERRVSAGDILDRRSPLTGRTTREILDELEAGIRELPSQIKRKS